MAKTKEKTKFPRINSKLRDWIDEQYPESEILLADGFDSALIGIATRCASPDVAVYDYDRMVKVLTEEGMPEDEAEEYLDFNVLGAYVGPNTPYFLNKCPKF